MWKRISFAAATTPFWRRAHIIQYMNIKLLPFILRQTVLVWLVSSEVSCCIALPNWLLKIDDLSNMCSAWSNLCWL
ncbi:hypothetical protein BDV38DRAFT_244522, partial [Aspergillus pseudotamarii]